MGRAIAVFGSGSDVGKSTIAAAIGRILVTERLSVAPFKAQNMSNNSGVVRISSRKDGQDRHHTESQPVTSTTAATTMTRMGEIGRAQINQAMACKIEPETDMNPVLLKPASDTSSQIVLHGKVLSQMEAARLFTKTTQEELSLRTEAHGSLGRLMKSHDVVVIEGAGSCAEVNLRDRDYVNFDAAHACNTATGEDGDGGDGDGRASVILVCDIEKGGVFAQVVGTLAVIPEADKQLVKGIIVNKFRGDPMLFEDGRAWLEEETKLPVLAVVPYFDPLDVLGDGSYMVLDAEDGLFASSRVDPPLSCGDDDAHDDGSIRIAVILLPHISNHTDFSPLQAHPHFIVDYLRSPRDLSDYHLVILPGTKSVVRDIEWLHRVNWTDRVKHYSQRENGVLLGVCGGYQMLGQTVVDIEGCDSQPTCERGVQGIGILPVATKLSPAKITKPVERAVWLSDWLFPTGTPMRGYEIHCGETRVVDGSGKGGDSGHNSFKGYVLGKGEDEHDESAQQDRRQDDCDGPNGLQLRTSGGCVVIGTYLHGLFDGENSNIAYARMTNGHCTRDLLTNTASAKKSKTTDVYDALATHLLSALGEKGKKKLFAMAGL